MRAFALVRKRTNAMTHIIFCVAIFLVSSVAIAQESAGHQLAMVDAGHLLPKGSVEVVAVEIELDKTAKYFKTDPQKTANLVWYHVKEARAKGATTSVIDFMRAARQAISASGPLPPSAESLNLFGAYYQTSCCSK
jgi:hypothetical protein